MIRVQFHFYVHIGTLNASIIIQPEVIMMNIEREASLSI